MDKKINLANIKAELHSNSVKNKVKLTNYALLDTKSEIDYQSIVKKMDARKMNLFEWVTVDGKEIDPAMKATNKYQHLQSLKFANQEDFEVAHKIIQT